MASRIKLKSSTTPNSVPQISDLYDREVALNINDRTLFVNDNGTIREVLNADPNDETIVPAMLSSSITDGVGNTWYVSENGTDKATIGSVNPRHGSTTGANAWGKTPTTAFATLKYALNFAQAEDIIFIEAGTYTEEFPLTVPVDVTIKGRGLKSVFIQPTVGTNDQDAFLIQGNCNIEDITIRNFYYNDTNDTGYGFRLASGFVITERRPYIQRISVLTKGSVTSASDPRGYIEGDAGRGALVDGSVADSSTIEASLLFNECTFVVPNSVGLYLKNGARCEWLNSFTYYALDGILGESPDGGTGLGGVARTRLNLQGESGDFTAGSGNQVGLVEEGASNVNAAYTTSGADDLLSMTIASSAHGLSQGDLIYINTTSGGQSGLTQFRKILTSSTNSFTIDGIFAGTASAGNLTYIKVSGFGTIDENDGTYVYLQGKGEGRFIATDETTGKNITANGNVVTSTAQFKFGTSSAFFDGTGDWLSIPSDPDFNFSTGDYTLEAFVRLTNTSGNKVIFDFRSTSLSEISPVVYVSGSDVIYYVNGVAAITGAAALSPTTWHHVALSRASGISKLFVDGVQVGTSYTDGNDFPTRGLRIGANLQGASSMNGYIDEVRITKGSSRYNAGFTPTTTQFLADTNTALLLHMEGANSNAVFVDDSIVAQDVRTTAGGTATFVTLADYTKFGAELRSIASANVYGERGATANGQGVSLRLISHNFGYIGVGKDDNNDVSLVVQSNEVVEQNNGRVFFTSIDQSGDFRVGDLFLVDQEKGTLSFAGSGGAGAGAGTSFDQLLVSSGSDTTTILPTSIEVGAFTFFGNTISTTSGNINLTPFTGNEINLNQRVNLETFISGSTRLSLAFDGDSDTGIRKPIDLGDGYYDLVSNGGSVLRIAPGEVRALTDINISSSIPETISVGTPGTGYTVGTFTDIPVSGGSGTGLRADVVVTAFSGQVTQVGSGYVAGTFNNLAFTNVLGQNQQTGTGTGGTGTVTVKGIANGSITGGSGYTDNTYGDIPLNGGTGTGARASLTVSGGTVTEVNITNDGDSGYTAGDTLTVNNADLIYFDTEGNQLQSGGAGFAYTVPADSYTVTNVTPSGTWNGTGYQVGDAVTATVPGGGSGFVFEFSNLTFLSSANIVDEGEETAVTGEGYLTGELIIPAFELRANDTLAGIGTTVTYNVQVRPKSGGGGNAFWINTGSGYVEAPALTLNKDTLYKFVFAPDGTYPGTFTEHPFRFSETSDGSNTPGGEQYTTLSGALNANNGAYIIVTGDTPATLYYYCSIHTGMGGSVDTSADTEYGQGGQLAIGSAILENFLALSKQGNITAEGGIFNTNLTVNENFAALGQTTLTSVTAQNLTVAGTLTASGGIGTQGNLTVQGDLGTNGKLTVAGVPGDPSDLNGSFAFDVNLLQLDSSNNKVSIFGPTSPIEIEDYTFEVNSTAKIYNHVFLATDVGSVVSIGNDPGSVNIAQTFDEKFTVLGDSRFDGRILVNDGTEVAPSITFDSDEKLGFYSNPNEIITVGYNGPIMKQTTQQISFFKPVDLINKAIDEYTIIPGRGYVVGQYNTIVFRGGTGADFTANVTVGFTGDITQPGSGYYNEVYENVPVQYVNVASGAITVFGTLTPGSGYVDGTYANVSLTGGTGTLATGDFTIENGAVTSVIINSRGSGYAVSDLLGVTTADVGGNKLSGNLTVDVSGSGYPDGTYTDVQLVNNVGSGSGATANIVVSGGLVSSATVNQGGGGYTNSDTFTVADSDLYQNLTFNYTVTNNGTTNYVISGDDRNTTHSSASNPSINVNIGDTISFAVSATGHPFYLVSQLDPTTGGFNAAYVLPATNNGSENGTVSFDTSLTIPGTYYYVCANHPAMVGTIIVGSVTYGSGAAFSAQSVTTGSGFSIRVSNIGATGTGSNAQARLVVEGGAVTEFNITSPGSGYLIGDVLTVDYTDLTYTDPQSGQLVTSTAPSTAVEYTVRRLNSVSYVNILDLGAGYSVDDVLDLPNDFYDATALGLTLFPTEAAVNAGQEFYAGEYAYEVTSAGTTGNVVPSFGQDGVSGINTISGGSGYPSSATIERIQCEATTGIGTGLLVDIVTNGAGAVTSISPSGNLSGDLFQVGDQFTLDNNFINTGAASISITSGGDNGAYGDTQVFDLNQTATTGTGANILVRFTSDVGGNIVSATIISNGIGYQVGDIIEFDGSLFGGGGGGGEEVGAIADDPTTVFIVVNSLTNGSGANFTVSSIASSVVNGTATIAHNGYFPSGFSLTVNTLAEYNNIQFDAVDGIVTAKKLVASPDGVEIATTMLLNNNTISTTSGNLTLNAEANSQVVIGGSGALALPVGNDTNRPGGPLQGSVRYNTDRNQFEGYDGSYFVSLGGVRDVDGNTFIVGEKTPGGNDNNLWFYNDGTQTLRVSQTELNLDTLNTINSNSYGTAEEWTSEAVVTQFVQDEEGNNIQQYVFSGDNVYSIDNDGTYGTVAPDHTAGTVANGNVNLTWLDYKYDDLNVNVDNININVNGKFTLSTNALEISSTATDEIIKTDRDALTFGFEPASSDSYQLLKLTNNGALQINRGFSSTADNYLTILDAGLQKLELANTKLFTQTSTLDAATGNIVAATMFPWTEAWSGKFMVEVEEQFPIPDAYPRKQYSEISYLVKGNGTDILYTESNKLYTDVPLADVEADLSGSNVQVRVTELGSATNTFVPVAAERSPDTISFTTFTRSIASVYDPNADRIVIAGVDWSGNSSVGFRVGNVSHNTIIFGSQIPLSASGNVNSSSLAFDPISNRIVWAAESGQYIVGEVNPNNSSINFGSAGTFTSDTIAAYSPESSRSGRTCRVLSVNGKIVVVYQNDLGGVYAVYGTVTGGSVNSISWSSPTELISGIGLQDAFTDGTYLYVNYSTGVVVKFEVDASIINTGIVATIGGGTNVQWSVFETTRVLKMYYNTSTSEIQARYYDLNDLSEVGFTVSTGINSQFFSVSKNKSTNEFMFVAALDYSTSNDAEQNVQGVITANGDDLDYTSRSRTYAALDQPVNIDNTYTNAGDSDVLYVGTRVDGEGKLHDVFVTTASTASNISFNTAETVSFVSAIENRTTYNIKIVSQTVKR